MIPRILVGDDDRVELLPQLAGTDVGVVYRRQVELICSGTQRVHPSSMFPPVHGWYIATRGAWNPISFLPSDF
jgi:hypothetical protein